ncbi:hypothetical protein [Burkholderia sp. Ac-20353]|uniref:hypothetical protein n=1 Tax=Burkholderia sp. Ac-20353 TaxID=2703894 RepID=UPI00197B1482|nr:hypothetical protein [Burkholderia sp. Ac-20353]MBN3786731.1 hypothetical protein [Burkholderia sp. Ac-20353]
MRHFRPPSRILDHVARCTHALLAFAALSVCATAHGSGAEAADDPCAKVDAGYALDDSVRGAFGSPPSVNACIDVLRAQHDGPRRLRIFVDGKRVVSNDAIAMGPDEGGAMGDPYQSLEVSRGSLVVGNAGGGGPMRWNETWHLTIRNGQWIIAGWDFDGWDWHRAADGGGEFHTSVNALTGDVTDSYASLVDDNNDNDDTPPKHTTHRACKLPPGWRSPAIAQVAAIRDRSWRCDAKLAKPIRSGK